MGFNSGLKGLMLFGEIIAICLFDRTEIHLWKNAELRVFKKVVLGVTTEIQMANSYESFVALVWRFLWWLMK
jgi:hypothetical protein